MDHREPARRGLRFSLSASIDSSPVSGTDVAMATGSRQLLDLGSLGANQGERATFLVRGAAADIWVVESPNVAIGQPRKYISKTLRVGPETFQDRRGNLIHDSGSDGSIDTIYREFIQDLQLKVNQWNAFRHRNIIKIFGLGQNLDLQVEFCKYGTARQYLESHNQDPKKKKIMISDVLRGVEYLHSMTPPVVHGCLNADKLFVTKGGKTKIGEFGLATLTLKFAFLAPSISYAGLSRWMSPELVDFDPEEGEVASTIASDVWALGCTLLEIIQGEIPYSKNKHELRVRREIAQGKPPGHPLPNSSDDLFCIWPILESCWKKSPELRLSVPTLRRLMRLVILAFESPTPQDLQHLDQFSSDPALLAWKRFILKESKELLENARPTSLKEPFEAVFLTWANENFKNGVRFEHMSQYLSLAEDTHHSSISSPPHNLVGSSRTAQPKTNPTRSSQNQGRRFARNWNQTDELAPARNTRSLVGLLETGRFGLDSIGLRPAKPFVTRSSEYEATSPTTRTQRARSFFGGNLDLDDSSSGRSDTSPIRIVRSREGSPDWSRPDSGKVGHHAFPTQRRRSPVDLLYGNRSRNQTTRGRCMRCEQHQLSCRFDLLGDAACHHCRTASRACVMPSTPALEYSGAFTSRLSATWSDEGPFDGLDTMQSISTPGNEPLPSTVAQRLTGPIGELSSRHPPTVVTIRAGPLAIQSTTPHPKLSLFGDSDIDTGAAVQGKGKGRAEVKPQNTAMSKLEQIRQSRILSALYADYPRLPSPRSEARRWNFDQTTRESCLWCKLHGLKCIYSLPDNEACQECITNERQCVPLKVTAEHSAAFDPRLLAPWSNEQPAESRFQTLQSTSRPDKEPLPSAGVQPGSESNKVSAAQNLFMLPATRKESWISHPRPLRFAEPSASQELWISGPSIISKSRVEPKPKFATKPEPKPEAEAEAEATETTQRTERLIHVLVPKRIPDRPTPASSPKSHPPRTPPPSYTESILPDVRKL